MSFFIASAEFLSGSAKGVFAPKVNILFSLLILSFAGYSDSLFELNSGISSWSLLLNIFKNGSIAQWLNSAKPRYF